MTGRRSERAAVAGLEGVMFAVLVLVTGTLVVTNAWSVLQSRRTLDGAAREYLRAYTQADGPGPAALAARSAMIDSLSGEGVPIGSVSFEGPDPTGFGPCASATVTLSRTVPALRLPFVGRISSTRVSVTHTELVDAHREMSEGRSYDPESTACVQ